MITKAIMIALLLIVIPFLPHVTALPDIMNSGIDLILGGFLTMLKIFPSFGDVKIILGLWIGIMIGQVIWKITKQGISWIWGGSN